MSNQAMYYILLMTFTYAFDLLFNFHGTSENIADTIVHLVHVDCVYLGTSNLRVLNVQSHDFAVVRTNSREQRFVSGRIQWV